jgi:type VI secretion system secreted protein Hcp
MAVYMHSQRFKKPYEPIFYNKKGKGMFDCFLRVEGISGESSDDKHVGWIEIMNFDLDVSQKVSRTASSAGGASTERADFSVFSFSKLLDKASPQLALACAAGTHIDTIVVELGRAGTDKTRFMQYKFTNCMICSCSTTADGGFPVDDVAFSYGKIEWRHTQQNRRGGYAAGNVAGGWSLEKNCKV